MTASSSAVRRCSLTSAWRRRMNQMRHDRYCSRASFSAPARVAEDACTWQETAGKRHVKPQCSVGGKRPEWVAVQGSLCQAA